MTRIPHLLRILSAASVFAIFALVGTGRLAAEDKKEKTEIEKLNDRVSEFEKKVESNLNNADTSLYNLKTDVLKLRDQLKEISDKLDAKSAPAASSDGTPRRMPLTEDDLRKKLEKAERDIADLKAQLAAGRSTSQRVDGTTAKPGQVRIRNSVAGYTTFIINNKSYELAPMRELDVDVPAGSFSFAVPQYQPTVQYRTVREGEVYTLNLHNN